MAQVKPIPEGFNTVSVCLVVPDAQEALRFYARAFGAETILRMPGPDGKGTMHAEMRIGDSTVMLTDENPQWNLKSPKTLGGSPVSLHLYVADVDAWFQRAVEAGCEVAFPLHDAFWGDRYAKVRDPYGHEWGLATHKEDLTPEQIAQRGRTFFEKLDTGCAPE